MRWAVLTLGAGLILRAQPPLATPSVPSAPAAAPKETEQQELMRLLSEAASSTIDLIRVLEAHL